MPTGHIPYDTNVTVRLSTNISVHCVCTEILQIGANTWRDVCLFSRASYDGKSRDGTKESGMDRYIK